MHSIVSALAGILMLLSMIPYARSVLKGDGHPSVVSWLIWFVLNAIMLVSMWSKGTLNYQLVATTLGLVIMIAIVLRHGTFECSAVNIMCIAGAMCGLTLMWVCNDATVGIVICALLNALAAVPTFISAWNNPRAENRVAWLIMFLSCLCQISIVRQWTWDHASQPVSYLFVSSTVMYLVWVWPARECPKPESSMPVSCDL